MRRSARFLAAIVLLVGSAQTSRAWAGQAAPVTNADVVRMVAAGLSDDVVVRAIRAANADGGIDEAPTWHALVKVVLEAAAARGTALTRKEVSEAWLRLHQRTDRQD